MSLLDAVRKNDPDLVKLLISQGVDVDMDPVGRGTALYVAACEPGYIACARTLLQMKADTERAGEEGWLPIHRATARGGLEFVKVCSRSLFCSVLFLERSRPM